MSVTDIYKLVIIFNKHFLMMLPKSFNISVSKQLVMLKKVFNFIFRFALFALLWGQEFFFFFFFVSLIYGYFAWAHEEIEWSSMLFNHLYKVCEVSVRLLNDESCSFVGFYSFSYLKSICFVDVQNDFLNISWLRESSESFSQKFSKVSWNLNSSTKFLSQKTWRLLSETLEIIKISN